MGNWKTCTIGDLGTIVGGATPSTKKAENYDGGTISWITPKDLAGFSGRFISRGERNITEQGLKSCSTQLMPAHTVLFSSRAPIGYIAIAEQEVCTNQGFKSVVPNEDTDYMFLYYLLKYNKNKIENLGSGTTFKEVSGSTMRGIEVSVPENIEEQRQIASVLSVLDDKIEKNTEVNDNLFQQAQAIFDSFFPDITSGDKTVGDYITPKRGKNLLSKDAVPGEVPVVAGGLEPATYHNQSNTTAPVLTVSASGANAGFINLWNIPVWSSDSSFIDTTMTKDVYFWYVLLKKRQQEIFDSQTGSAQPHIYPQHIAVLPLSDLNNKAVASYTSKVTPLFDMIGANKRENNCLASVRDALLPKLMSGELDVSRLDI